MIYLLTRFCRGIFLSYFYPVFCAGLQPLCPFTPLLLYPSAPSTPTPLSSTPQWLGIGRDKIPGRKAIMEWQTFRHGGISVSQPGCYIYIYWMTQKLPQICTAILRICIGKVARFAVYICGNFWVTQYILGSYFILFSLFYPNFSIWNWPCF